MGTRTPVSAAPPRASSRPRSPTTPASDPPARSATAAAGGGAGGGGGGEGASLSAEQRAVLDLVLSGKSVFFTGSAGTGKSFLLRRIVEALREEYEGSPDAVHVTASTGIAACNIGGVTIHSFGGIGVGAGPARSLVQKVRGNAKALTRWRRARVIVVDEVSMLDGWLFDKLDFIARTLRNNQHPFGGIQLVLCGDFFQLPPVGLSDKRGTRNRRRGAEGMPDVQVPIFCFEAQAWSRTVQASVVLGQVFRQKDNRFVQILNEIRLGRLTPAMQRALTTEGGSHIRRLEADGHHWRATKLYVRNAEVDRENEIALSSCGGDTVEFLAKDEGSDSGLLRQLQQHCNAPTRIVLRVGAQVVLLKNLDTASGLVNGSMGHVLEFAPSREGGPFSEVPVVEFRLPDGDSVTRRIEAADWMVQTGDFHTAVRWQLPLKLAYALSVHKSQGMTLPFVEVNLAGAFEHGQAYVALSRAVSLEGLRVTHLDAGCVFTHPKVVEFYNRLAGAGQRMPLPPSLPPPPPLPPRMTAATATVSGRSFPPAPQRADAPAALPPPPPPPSRPLPPEAGGRFAGPVARSGFVSAATVLSESTRDAGGTDMAGGQEERRGWKRGREGEGGEEEAEGGGGGGGGGGRGDVTSSPPRKAKKAALRRPFKRPRVAPVSASPPRPAGDGAKARLVAQELAGLTASDIFGEDNGAW